MADPLISTEGVSLRFRRSEDAVLDDVSMHVREGELVALIGPSGCGKSTLLNLVSGLLAPSAGRVQVREGVRMAYVFQSPRLLRWRTLQGNVEFGLEGRGLGRGALAERAQRALAQVNLTGHERKYPQELSGGMQQRAALARGLAIDPAVCLLDEPFGALDALTRSYLQDELMEIVRGTGMTTMLVTHDIDEALLLADRVIVMTARPGRLSAEVDVPFGAERSSDALLGRADYAELRRQLREMLRPQAAIAA